VSVSDITSLITGAGVAGVVLVLIVLGWLVTKGHVEDLKQGYEQTIEDKDKQITELKDAVTLANQRADSERRRGDAATEAVNTSNLLLAGIRKGIGSD
jgi:hypothetical protein